MMTALLAKASRNPETSDKALHVYVGRNPHLQFKSHEDLGKSPVMGQSIPPSKAEPCLKPPYKPTRSLILLSTFQVYPRSSPCGRASTAMEFLSA